MPEEVKTLHQGLKALEKKLNEAEEEELITEGFGDTLFAALGHLRDAMLPLHTKYKDKGFTDSSVLLWRKLNEEIPNRINEAQEMNAMHELNTTMHAYELSAIESEILEIPPAPRWSDGEEEEEEGGENLLVDDNDDDE
jgi:hypothetical protein